MKKPRRRKPLVVRVQEYRVINGRIVIQLDEPLGRPHWLSYYTRRKLLQRRDLL